MDLRAMDAREPLANQTGGREVPADRESAAQSTHKSTRPREL